MLTTIEEPGALTLGPAAKVELLIDGEVINATIQEGKLAPGENGLLKFAVDARVVRRGNRFAVLHKGALVAAGVVAPNDFVLPASDSQEKSSQPSHPKASSRQ
ncbi:MAG: hypothetical protein JXB05_15950 [Myxococcaceae bacterium]|nr:hypothetical protein [Myxococcaceae bacterium]